MYLSAVWMPAFAGKSGDGVTLTSQPLIPAKAGTQERNRFAETLGPRLRGDERKCTALVALLPV
jgi:hypothetical protein